MSKTLIWKWGDNKVLFIDRRGEVICWLWRTGEDMGLVRGRHGFSTVQYAVESGERSLEVKWRTREDCSGSGNEVGLVEETKTNVMYMFVLCGASMCGCLPVRKAATGYYAGRSTPD